MIVTNAVKLFCTIFFSKYNASNGFHGIPKINRIVTNSEKCYLKLFNEVTTCCLKYGMMKKIRKCVKNTQQKQTYMNVQGFTDECEKKNFRAI